MYITKKIRIVIITDSFYVSPGGFSALNNLANGLSLIGCEVILAEDLDEDILTGFMPSIIIFSVSNVNVSPAVIGIEPITLFKLPIALPCFTKCKSKFVNENQLFAK